MSYRKTPGMTLLLNAFGVLALGLAVAACGSNSYATEGSGSARGADAIVELSPIEGGGSMVNVEIRHLLPPGRVGRSTTYVVWFVAADTPAQNVGRLQYDGEHRTGLLRATSPARSFEVRVTAEDSGNASSPSTDVVVSQMVTAED